MFRTMLLGGMMTGISLTMKVCLFPTHLWSAASSLVMTTSLLVMTTKLDTGLRYLELASRRRCLVLVKRFCCLIAVWLSFQSFPHIFPHYH